MNKRLSCRYHLRQHGNHRNDEPDAGQCPTPSASDSSSAPGSSRGLLVAHGDSTLVVPTPVAPADLGPLGRFPGLIQRAGSIEQHALHHTIRVLRTYPRMLSARTQLPPFIHHSQTQQGALPQALKTCHEILTNNGRDYPSLQDQILMEITNLKKTVSAILSNRDF